MWHEKMQQTHEEPQSVKFEIGGSDPRTPPIEEGTNDADIEWECIWKCRTATPIHHMAFSPDGSLFATSGKSDRLVKVWFQNKHCKFLLIFQLHFIDFSFKIKFQYYSLQKVWINNICHKHPLTIRN